MPTSETPAVIPAVLGRPAQRLSLPGDSTASRAAWTVTALAGILALGLCCLLVRFNPAYLFAVPAAGVALTWLWAARPTELISLVGVLVVVYVLMGGTSEGVSGGEIASLALSVVYLGYWYCSRLLGSRNMCSTSSDMAMSLWLTFGIFGSALTAYIFGFNPTEFRGELIASISYFFYFPVKEVCRRDKMGPVSIATLIIVLGTYTSLSNIILLQNKIADATMVWQIADARVTVGEPYMMSAFILSLALVPGSNWRGTKMLLAVTSSIAGAGLILSRSRSFWVVVLVGVGLLFLLSGMTERRKIALFSFAFLTAAFIVLLIRFRTEAMLIASGTVNRFSTLSTATQQDISLLNRFSEWKSLWSKIKINPILGYGWGVPFTHFSYISHTWFTWSYTHNGWLGLWYKNGLWGLGLMVWIWVGASVNAIRLARMPSGSFRLIGVGIASVIIPYTISINTANPFVLKDLALAVTLFLALAHGTYQQAARDTAGRDGRGPTLAP